MNLLPTWKRRGSNGDIARLRDEMDRTFERFFSDPFGVMQIEPKSLREEGWLPPIDLSETDNDVTIRLEAPGIPAKDLEISVTGTTLNISGKKEEKEEKKGENFFQCERRFGAFRRSIELPETIDADKFTAEADNGVVTIRVPKKPGAKPKQIEVKPVAKKVPVSS